MEISMGEERLDAGPAILEVLARRWSPRAWADRPVEPEKLAICLEAARWAASSMNQQPWRFIVTARDQPNAHGRLAACLNEKNAQWARHAPVLMLSVAKQTFDGSEEPNRFAWHDTGLATAAVMIQATALGMHIHVMGGFSRAKARESFSIPKGYDPVAAIAMGYLGETDSLPEDLRDAEIAPRLRRPCKAWAFTDIWGRVASTHMVNENACNSREPFRASRQIEAQASPGCFPGSGVGP